jgi:hypothetical protein
MCPECVSIKPVSFCGPVGGGGTQKAAAFSVGRGDFCGDFFGRCKLNEALAQK